MSGVWCLGAAYICLGLTDTVFTVGTSRAVQLDVYVCDVC